MKNETFNCENITSFGLEYSRIKARQYAYTTVSTVRRSLCAPERKSIDYSSFKMLTELLNDSAAGYHANERDTMRGMISEREGITMQHKVKHHREKRHGLLVEVEPWESMEFTESGREYMQIETTHSTDFEDLVSVAYLAILEMIYNGTIRDFADFDKNRRAVYHAVNAEIYKSRKATRENETYDKMCIICTENGTEYNEKVLYGANIERYFSDIQTVDIITSLKECVQHHFTARYANTERANASISAYCSILDMLYNGYTVREIAAALDVSERAAQKKIEILRNISAQLFDYTTVKKA